MKVSFSFAVDYTPTWRHNRALPDKDRISCVLKPLDVGDLLILMDAIGGRPNTSEGDITVQFDQVRRIIKDVVHLLPKYVSISNLEDEAGPVTVENMIKYPYYMDLSAELIMKLAEISMPGEDAEKNSEQQPV